MRNIAKFSPKMAKKTVIFRFFSIFSQTVHTIRTKARQKEKDLSRLLYRICGSGFKIYIKELRGMNKNVSNMRFCLLFGRFRGYESSQKRKLHKRGNRKNGFDREDKNEKSNGEQSNLL